MYAPQFLLNMKHVDGQQSILNVSQGAVVLSYKGEQFVQKLDRPEMSSLNAILLGGANAQD